jgi:hypothetical protein
MDDKVDYENGTISEIEAARIINKLRIRHCAGEEEWKIYFYAGIRILKSSGVDRKAIEEALE